MKRLKPIKKKTKIEAKTFHNTDEKDLSIFMEFLQRIKEQNK